ncbi:ankyrin repeat and sterile alpha motif domain-containing protein 1B isoform X4 [Paramormyrops kingsleyae]|uniref:ankyrin repeat and sterile alpha motif domain-containing protein 1B isoform X4 n=1 Tax=Paramormyrops kingsleyae TaxID=1676925 RepID=UPI003B9776BE
MGKEQELLEAARTGNVTLVEKLLSGKKGLLGTASGSIPLPSLLSIWRGLNVNCADSSGYTPLHHASLNGHRDVVLKLLQFEASTNVADSKGCFPLHLAAWKGDVEIVRILIRHGPSHCRVNEQNHENETALHCAAQYGHSEVVRVLLEELTDPTMRNNHSETALDLAALYGRLQVVRMLVRAHPHLMCCGRGGLHTPLHLAARNGHRAVALVLLEAGMDVNARTEKGSALHEAALFGKMDVVRLLLDAGIDANIRDSHGRTALEILREHPAPKSQQITALIQEYMDVEMDGKSAQDEPIRHCPIPTPRTSMSSPAASPSLRIKNEAVTGELSKLLNEIKMCRDKEYSFEDLCHTISSHSMESFGGGRHVDEQRNGTLTRVHKRRSPPLAPAPEEDESEKSCGPAVLWEALTPCNGCRNLGFPGLSQYQDSKQPADIIPSPSLDVFLPEDEDNPFEFVTKAVTRKPCSLDIGRLTGCSEEDDSPHVTITEPDLRNHGNGSAGPTPDCSPPSPDTALKNIEKVIRPQPKQRMSLSSTQETQRPNHSYDPSEVSSSLGYASFSASPPLSPALSPAPGSAFSPANYSIGSAEDCGLADDVPVEDDFREGHVPDQFAGLLHGSSPACESPDNPYQLYGKEERRGQPGTGRTSPSSRLERTPSFTAEWEEIDKIMSSIGAGISTELEEIKEDASGPRCPVQSVGQWLDNIGLVQYENHLLANGFDNVQFMGSNVVEDQDLLEIGILNSAHRQRLLQAIRLLPRVRPIGYDGNNPTSVAEWLESLELGDYTKSFLINGYTSMELVKKIWEIELINVLKISLLGHRKRILASLGDRLHDDPPQKPPRAISLREPTGNHTPPQLSPSLSQSAYTTAGSLDVQHLMMQADARRRRNDNYFDDVPRSKLERQMAQVSMQGEWCEPITLRPPNEATSSTPVQYWQHHPEKLIFQSCDYEAYYLGSMLVKELRGTESTQDVCSKMRKSTEQMKKIPTIVLSVSYKGVKFIDATNKNIIAEHEIRNISCAAQDPEDLSTFAYITKDLKSSHHYCHVFTAFDVNLAYEIILTLGQAFEVAYQLALQARKSGHGSSTLPESFDSKPAKPIPKPRVNIRKSMEQPSMDQKGHANVPWIVEPGQEAKRGVNTKAVPDAHVFYCGMQRM